MASITLTITTPEAPASDFATTGESQRCLANAARLLQSFATGCEVGSVDVQVATVDPVAASGTITLVSVPPADTVTIAGVVLTSSASPTGNAQFSQAGTDAADAASLASIINAHPTLSRHVAASAASNVVTVTSTVKGPIGNLISMSRTGTAMTLSAANLAGGAGGAVGPAVTYTR